MNNLDETLKLLTQANSWSPISPAIADLLPKKKLEDEERMRKVKNLKTN